MKKVFGLFVAAATTATMFVSCNCGANAKVETHNDTINYAFGAANGAGIRQYVLGDTLTEAQMKLFCDGFAESFDKDDRKKAIAIEGYRMGNSMRQEFGSGFLFGDSTLKVNKELLMSVFTDALNGKYFMRPDAAMERFRALMAESLSTGGSANVTPEQADSINMFFALINGQGARRFLLVADTTASDIKTFLKGIDKGMASTDADRWYLEGVQIGTTLNQQLAMSPYLFGDSTIEMERALIQKGLLDVCTTAADAIMTGEEAQNYITAVLEARTAAKDVKDKENAAVGEAFLAENATKEGVVVTESGLQYKVVTMGNGQKPSATDKVKVHYHGTLIDGTVFDSSVERGEPIEFPLDGVIKGWTEGLQLMPVGSKYILYIPYQLAYGERGAGEDIPPYSALIFEVELLEIVK